MPAPSPVQRLPRRTLLRAAASAALTGVLAGCLKEPAPTGPGRADLAAPLYPPLASGATPRTGQKFTAQADKVLDGDTFEFRHEGQAYSVRLSGIDAPERTQPHADQSRQALRDMIGQQIVAIEVLKLDVYKRLVARISVFSGGQWRDVGEQMLDLGLAWHFRRYARDQPAQERERYAQTEARARAQARGIWRDGNPEAPWDFRDRQRGTRGRGSAGTP